MTRAFTLLGFLGLTLLMAVPAAHAQSTFAVGGLGVPIAPIDARARALGGIGTALPGWNLSLINPAEAVGIPFRGITAAYQSQSGQVELGGANDDFASSRFPMLRVVYPLRSGLVATVGYGGFLDQSWAAFEDRTIVLGADTVNVRDMIDSSGGLSSFQIGVGYPVARSLAVGVAGGFYSGRNHRTLTRSFIGTGLADVESELRWRQRAPFVTAGLRWDPSSAFRFAGAVTWAGTLDAHADPVEGQALQHEDFELDLPLQATAGMSALLAPRLNAVVAGRWEGWSDTAADTEDVWQIGGGLEWEGIRTGDRFLPLRVGYHYSRFPQRFRGGQPTERAAALGLGIPLAVTDFGPRGLIDAALERGTRSDPDDNLSERFWRFTLSLSLFGS